MRVLLSAMYHLLAASSFLVRDMNPVHLGIVLFGTICFVIFYIKNKETGYLLSRYNSLQKSFYFIEALLVLAIFFVESMFLSILFWGGLFLIEIIRGKIGNKLLHLEDALERLEEEREQQNLIFRKIRAQRHDFLKHANVTQHLLQENRVEEAIQYFNELIGEYQQVNATVKGEEGHMAAILFRYQKLCQDSQIQVAYDLEVPLSALPMKKTDQSKLISNLLENSLEAARAYRQQKEKGRIEVRSSLYGGIYILELTNNTLPLPNELSDYLFSRFEHTTKTGQHEGLGTFIIASMVKQYHGDLSYKYMGNELSVKIKLPNIQ